MDIKFDHLPAKPGIKYQVHIVETRPQTFDILTKNGDEVINTEQKRTRKTGKNNTEETTPNE